jgi:hypothetical protein
MVPDKEIDAMAAIASALDKFTEEEREIVERILGWACSRYNVNIGAGRSTPVKGAMVAAAQEDGQNIGFEDIADLYAAANPKTASDKALIAGYWLATGEGSPDFAAQEINKHLKNLGHGVSNITDALSSLISRRPSLVMQTAKSGKSKQARKKYKLTRAGLDRVTAMISAHGNGEEQYL